MNGQEIRVEGEQCSHRFTFANCILAVGAEATPCELSYDGVQVLTPEQALALPSLPSALSVYGNDLYCTGTSNALCPSGYRSYAHPGLSNSAGERGASIGTSYPLANKISNPPELDSPGHY